jgi:hypothetical protein
MSETGLPINPGKATGSDATTTLRTMNSENLDAINQQRRVLQKLAKDNPDLELTKLMEINTQLSASLKTAQRLFDEAEAGQGARSFRGVSLGTR